MITFSTPPILPKFCILPKYLQISTPPPKKNSTSGHFALSVFVCEKRKNKCGVISPVEIAFSIFFLNVKGGSKFGGILGGYKILEVLGVLKM
jgi:hypothetical protein